VQIFHTKKILKSVQLQGDSPPDPTPGALPLGASPPDPVRIVSLPSNPADYAYAKALPSVFIHVNAQGYRHWSFIADVTCVQVEI